MMRFLLLAGMALLLALVFSTGCATPAENEVSPLPWNRPASWEGQGALGAMPMPGSGR